MINPPIVGVPDFFRWDSGPSSLTNCPNFNFFKKGMIIGLQITPLQLMRAAATVVNGGNLVTPHFGVYTTDENNIVTDVLKYETKTGAVSTATSETMKELLEAVVAEGTGHRAYIEGYRIGGKTATSEKLPRSENRYISSFLGFAPANDPQVMTLILIDEPQGVYYGGTIAAPVVGEI